MTIEIEPFERARMLWDVITSGGERQPSKDEFLRIVSGGLTRASLAEREACAKVAEIVADDMLTEEESRGAFSVAAAIRARGER